MTAHQILSYGLLDNWLGTPEDERLSWSTVTDRVLQEATEALKNATKRLYSDSPLGDDAIPLTLPLSHYAGV